MTGTLLPDLGRAILHNWSCWLLLIILAPPIWITAIFAGASGSGVLALILPAVLSAMLIGGWILLAISHAMERHTADRWSRGRE